MPLSNLNLTLDFIHPHFNSINFYQLFYSLKLKDVLHQIFGTLLSVSLNLRNLLINLFLILNRLAITIQSIHFLFRYLWCSSFYMFFTESNFDCKFVYNTFNDTKIRNLL